VLDATYDQKQIQSYKAFSIGAAIDRDLGGIPSLPLAVDVD
jgi:hypothetical protein